MSRIESTKPSKQRKAFYKRPMHLVSKELSVHVPKALRKTVGKRSVRVRKDDKVKIVRGKFKGREGKIVGFKKIKRRVLIDGLTRKKANGKEIFVPIHASNLELVELFSKDKLRLKRVNKEAKVEEKKSVQAKHVLPKADASQAHARAQVKA